MGSLNYTFANYDTSSIIVKLTQIEANYRRSLTFYGEGFAVFAVIGMRKLWDEWYEEGNLVENLNDTTSLTYMVLQGLSGSKPRDLSLVEKIECTRNGSIYFVAKSVQTDKVPKVANRVRAYIHLNGWVLEPISINPPKTKVSYVLQTQIKGWIPVFVANKYLSKRPLILNTIDKYLQKNGPPPTLIGSTPPRSRSPSFSVDLSSTESRPLSLSTAEDSATKYRRSSQRISFPESDVSIKMNLINESAAFKSININGADKNYNVSSTIIKRSSNRLSITYSNTTDDDQNKNEESKQLENFNENIDYSEINSQHERNKSRTNRESLSHQDKLKLQPLQPSKQSTNVDIASISNDSSLENTDSPTLPKGFAPFRQDDDEKEEDEYDNDQKENIKEIIAEDLQEEIITQQKDVASSFSISDQYSEEQSQPSLKKSKKSSSSSRKKHNHKSTSQPIDNPSSSSKLYPAILKNKKTHRHTNALKKALDKFKSESSSLQGWNLYSENKGFKIYMKDVVGKSTPLIRGEMAITGGYTAEDVYAIAYSLDMKKLWDDRYEGGEIIEFLNDYDCLVRVAMKGTFPVSGRDMSLAGMLDREEGTGIIRYVTVSVNDPLIPQSKRHVRADLHFAGWEFIPTYFDSNPNRIKSVFCKYIVDIDIKLATVPSSILKQFSVQTPIVVLKINELLHKIGYPPYMLLESSSSTALLPDQLDIKTYDYVTTIKAFPGSIAEIKFSKLMYPNGFDISFECHNDNDVKVELLANDSEIIRITNADTKGYKLTYNNGEKIIPVVPKEKISKTNKEKIDKERLKSSNNHDDRIKNKNINSDSRILTKDKDNNINKVEEPSPKENNSGDDDNDDIIDTISNNKNNLDLDNDKTLVSKNIDIINKINDDSDSNNDKNKQQHKNRKSVTSISRISISEQTFIKQKINSRSSLKSVTTTTTDFGKKILSADNIGTTSNITKYNSVPAISSPLWNDEINNSQIERKPLLNLNNTNKRFTKIIIEFNTQQLVMMILSMAMSYYAGKLNILQTPAKVRRVMPPMLTATIPVNLSDSFMVVSNAIKIDDILIALSCFEGDGVLIESSTWVFSAVYDKQIQTAIDNIGGVVRFLDNVVLPYSFHSDKGSDSNLN
ncbi:5140_t:CDS:10 [Entrophospora sp. SA101]|nr:5140_t:CDS:10 [Entrophospora sp. SA101]